MRERKHKEMKANKRKNNINIIKRGKTISVNKRIIRYKIQRNIWKRFWLCHEKRKNYVREKKE